MIKKSLITSFEDELCSLIDRYLEDGLKPEEVTKVLTTRSGDDYNETVRLLKLGHRAW